MKFQKGHRPTPEFWLDMGNIVDINHAVMKFERNKTAFIPHSINVLLLDRAR